MHPCASFLVWADGLATSMFHLSPSVLESVYVTPKDMKVFREEESFVEDYVI